MAQTPSIPKGTRDYSPEINKELMIYCYQPSEGYCACAFLEEPEDPAPSNQS